MQKSESSDEPDADCNLSDEDSDAEPGVGQQVEALHNVEFHKQAVPNMDEKIDNLVELCPTIERDTI